MDLAGVPGQIRARERFGEIAVWVVGTPDRVEVTRWAVRRDVGRSAHGSRPGEGMGVERAGAPLPLRYLARADAHVAHGYTPVTVTVWPGAGPLLTVWHSGTVMRPVVRDRPKQIRHVVWETGSHTPQSLAGTSFT